jgi:transposase
MPERFGTWSTWAPGLLCVQPEPHQVPEKRGPEEPQDHAFGRGWGGLTTKIHMLRDANGVPLHFLLSGGQASDIAYAQPLLDEAYIPSLRDCPRKRWRWLLADRGYDAEALRRYCDHYRMQPVIPLRSMKRKPRLGLPRLFDRLKYRQRNIIERMFELLFLTGFNHPESRYKRALELLTALQGAPTPGDQPCTLRAQPSSDLKDRTPSHTATRIHLISPRNSPPKSRKS